MTAASNLTGSLTNTSSMSADTADPNLGNNSDSETTTVKLVEPKTGSGIFLPLILKING